LNGLGDYGPQTCRLVINPWPITGARPSFVFVPASKLNVRMLSQRSPDFVHRDLSGFDVSVVSVFLCTAIAKDARQPRGFSPEAGARTFLSAASWEARMIIEIPRPVARAEVAADRNVRAPLGCGFAALRPLRPSRETSSKSSRSGFSAFAKFECFSAS
jgi:hypothetical protein